MARCKQGYLYLYGDYHKDTYDDLFEVHGQYCKRSGARDKQIVKQAEYDGSDTIIVLPVDAGAAGVSTYQQMAKTFMAEGFLVKRDPAPNNKSKLVRFQNFATACENGNVFIVWDSFDAKTREFIFKQLEQFDGERSTSSKKDEFPDVCASAANFLLAKKVRGRFSGSSVAGGSSKLSSYKKSIQ